MDVMISIEKTIQFEKWYRKIKDKRILNIVDARLLGVKFDFFGDHKRITRIYLNYAYTSTAG
jgi:putative component of toxin-antitoxin plasmid stabilization module